MINAHVQATSQAGLLEATISNWRFWSSVNTLATAMEVLRKLLNDEIKLRSKKNLVQSRSFADMLERTIHNTRTARLILLP